MRNSLLVFLSGAAHSRMKLPGFPGSCNYVVNSLRQLVETLDPSPEYTYCHLFYEVVVIIDFEHGKYTDKASQKTGIFSALLPIFVCHMSFFHTILTSCFKKVKCPVLFSF